MSRRSFGATATRSRSRSFAPPAIVCRTPPSPCPRLFEDGTPLDAKGVFIKELEDALLAGRVDVAVHSLKDLPTTLDPRFALAAVPARADARDAFVCESYWGLHMLPLHSRVATTSPRRQAMLLALRPDLEFVPMRGNIDTRLRKWAAGEADALVLASAGLDRLDRTEHVHQRFAVDELCPAPGQGALGLEVLSANLAAESRDGNALRLRTAVEAVKALNHAEANFATTAERAVLAALGGGCNLPLGAFCHAVDDQWHLHAMMVAPDGEAVIHLCEKTGFGVDPAVFGSAVAEKLRLRGAVELLQGTPQEA